MKFEQFNSYVNVWVGKADHDGKLRVLLDDYQIAGLRHGGIKRRVDEWNVPLSHILRALASNPQFRALLDALPDDFAVPDDRIKVTDASLPQPADAADVPHAE